MIDKIKALLATPEAQGILVVLAILFCVVVLPPPILSFANWWWHVWF